MDGFVLASTKPLIDLHKFLRFFAYFLYSVDVLNPGPPMSHSKFPRFLRFLRQDLAIPTADLRLALRHPERTHDTLPMILWQYGLVTLSQLNQIFDWLECRLISEM
jgi:hypothetical protein